LIEIQYYCLGKIEKWFVVMIRKSHPSKSLILKMPTNKIIRFLLKDQKIAWQRNPPRWTPADEKLLKFSRSRIFNGNYS